MKIAIDDEAGQPISFSVDDAVGRSQAVAEERLPEHHGSLGAPLHEVGIDGGLARPYANRDGGLGIEDAVT
jgi:hypothetical protein